MTGAVCELARREQASDGRVSLVELTPHGRRLAERFLMQLEARTRPLVALWPPQRQRVAVEMLNELASTLEMALKDASVLKRPS